MITKAQLREENELLRQQCLKLEQDRTITEQKLLTAHQYLRDIKTRWSIHQKEFNQAVIDVKAAGSTAREVVIPTFSKIYSQLTLAKGFTK